MKAAASKHFRTGLLLLAWAASMHASQAQAQAQEPVGEAALQWVAGDLPPFAWRSADGPRGYAQELAMAMSQRLGRTGGVDYYPWARALKITEEGERFGIFPLTRTPERERRFRWLVPLDTVRHVFLGRAGDPALGLDSLRSRPIGVLRGSPLLAVLRAQGFKHVVQASGYADLFKLLNLHAVDALYAGGNMLDASIGQLGLARERYRVHLNFGQATVYMGASRRLPDAEAERWQNAYQQLVEDGTAARLRARYLAR